MADLSFGFIPFLRELDAIQELAGKLLERHALDVVLPQYKAQIESLRSTPVTGTSRFVISDEDPITTRPNGGSHESGGKGVAIFATVSSVWEVIRVPPNKKSRPADEFRLAGNASTRVRIYRTEDGAVTEWAMWRMEIGDEASPGCHFHVQVLGESADPPFPKLLPVPRLPSLIITPASVLEFVLGELFQVQWEKEMLRQEAALDRWTPVQQHRMRRLLDWHLGLVEKGPSPWLAMKKAKPSGDLFGRDPR